MDQAPSGKPNSRSSLSHSSGGLICHFTGAALPSTPELQPKQQTSVSGAGAELQSSSWDERQQLQFETQPFHPPSNASDPDPSDISSYFMHYQPQPPQPVPRPQQFYDPSGHAHNRHPASFTDVRPLTSLSTSSSTSSAFSEVEWPACGVEESPFLYQPPDDNPLAGGAATGTPSDPSESLSLVGLDPLSLDDHFPRHPLPQPLHPYGDGGPSGSTTSLHPLYSQSLTRTLHSQAGLQALQLPYQYQQEVNPAGAPLRPPADLLSNPPTSTDPLYQQQWALDSPHAQSSPHGERQQAQFQYSRRSSDVSPSDHMLPKFLSSDGSLGYNWLGPTYEEPPFRYHPPDGNSVPASIVGSQGSDPSFDPLSFYDYQTHQPHQPQKGPQHFQETPSYSQLQHHGRRPHSSGGLVSNSDRDDRIRIVRNDCPPSLRSQASWHSLQPQHQFPQPSQRQSAQRGALPNRVRRSSSPPHALHSSRPTSAGVSGAAITNPNAGNGTVTGMLDTTSSRRSAGTETPFLGRQCFNCGTRDTPSWRRSKLNTDKTVCNKCGLYERAHQRPRPPRSSERRSASLTEALLEVDHLADSVGSQDNDAGTRGGRESRVLSHLSQLLGLEGRSVNSLKGQHAAEVGNKLHLYLKSCSANQPEYAAALELLQDLCSSSGELPSSYELKNVTFDRGDLVGKGGEVSVYGGNLNGVRVVVREVAMPRRFWGLPAGQEIIKLIRREAIIHSQLDHPNIIPFLGVYYENTGAPPMIVLPFVEKGSLSDLILVEALKGFEFAWIITGIVRALAYLHLRKPPIFHGDVHPGNVLIDRSGNALLCDFGLSRVRHEVTRGLTNIRDGGRTRFLAPELLAGPEKFRTSATSDIFSLSMTLLNIWTREAPFVKLNERKAEAAIRKGLRPHKPTMHTDLSPEMEQDLWLLLVDMWVHEPQCRPSSEDIEKRLETVFGPLLLAQQRV